MSIQRSTVLLPKSNTALLATDKRSSIVVTLFLLLAMTVVAYSKGLRIGVDLPARTIIVIPLFLMIFWQSLLQGKRIITLSLGRWLIALWGVLLIWIALSYIAKSASLEGLLRQVVGLHFTALTTMLGIVLCTRGRSRHKLLTLILGGMIAFSGFVAIMQWLDQSWAWKLTLYLNVPEAASEYEVTLMQEASGSYVTGLFGTAFFASYFFAVGVPLLMPFMLYSRWRLFAAGLFFVTFTGMLVVQERSAFLSAMLCCAVFCLALFRHIKGRVFSVMLLSLLIIFGGYGVISWIIKHGESTARYSIDRYSNFDPGGRTVAYLDAIALASEEPLFGPTLATFQSGSSRGASTTPHNLFMNAMLFYGVPCLFITLLIAGLQTWLAWSVWKAAWKRNDYASIGCALGMIAYLLNCQLHNASMLNGDCLGWWITGLLIASRQNYQEESRAGQLQQQQRLSATRR